MVSMLTLGLPQFTNSAAMINGGPASLIYGFIYASLGALTTAASLAEMASMYPTR